MATATKTPVKKAAAKAPVASPVAARAPATKIPAPVVAATPATAVPAAMTQPATPLEPKPAKKPKTKKPKLVRDGCRMPESDYAVLGALKARAGALGQPAKKSTVLRAGIKALAAMSDAALLAALQAVPGLKAP